MKHWLAALAATFAIGAFAHGTSHVRSGMSRETVVRQPVPPQIAAVRGLRPVSTTELHLIYNAPRRAFNNLCAVAFDDPVALAALPNAASDGAAGAPWWFQNCYGSLGNYAVVRPVLYSHYHLYLQGEGEPCFDPNAGTLGHVQPDGSCSAAGIVFANEPRFLAPHWGDEKILLYVVNQYVNPKDPYSDSTYDKKPFDLRRLRVLNEPVRVCYKKVQEIAGPWFAAPDVHQAGSTPGVWLCWASLGAGLWDLSAWAFNVREVKITAADGSAIFNIDDIEIAVQ